METETKIIDLFIGHEREGEYFTIPFDVNSGPFEDEIESISIRYDYLRYNKSHTTTDGLSFEAHQEINIIDIGLINPQGEQVGASGSDKLVFIVSEMYATPGYRPVRIMNGSWEVLLGAYKVAPEGVNVHLEIKLAKKCLRLFKGDLHTHTLASDGMHTVEELTWKAKRSGLDFIAITDHNQMISTKELPHSMEFTVIPGIEWTHYRGHANFLGVGKPYEGCFATNTEEEAVAKFRSARERNALITINHPFEPGCEFRFSLEKIPFDCLEIWNGPMRESNLRAVGFWQQLLVSGKKIPVVGGSDYHRDTPFIFLGGPTMGVYSMSGGASDLLDATRNGHAYIVFSPDGPSAELLCNHGAMTGDTVSWPDQKQVKYKVQNLKTGDIIRLVTHQASISVFQANEQGDFEGVFEISEPGFIRLEVLRSFLPGVPPLPALITNPIYFAKNT